MDAHRGTSSLEHARASGGDSGHEHDPRVLVFGTFLAPDREALEALDHEGYVLVRCGDHHSSLEEMVQRPPAVLVFGMRPDCPQDLGLLHLIRRTLARVPLIVVAGSASLETQRQVQSLRPTYYAVCPLDPSELVEAVADALETRRRAQSTRLTVSGGRIGIG